jgi:PST family polysaccharide transporter
MRIRRPVVVETSHLVDDLRARSSQGVVFTGGGQAVRFALQFLSTVVLARLLTPDDFGVIAMVMAVAGFIGLFKDLGLSTATVQRRELSVAQVDAMFWIGLAVSAGLSGLTAAMAPLIAWFYGEPRLVSIAVAVGGAFLLTGLGVQHLALLRRQMRFAALAAVEVAASAAGVAAAIVLAALGARYWALVGLILVQAAASSAGAWTVCGWVPGRPRRAAGIRGMVVFGANLTGFNAVNYLMRNLDNVLIGWYWGAAPLGLYSRAYQLMLLPLQQVNAPLASVAVPTLSRLQDEAVRYRRAYIEVVEKLNLIVMPPVAFAAATSDWLILLVLGERWEGAARIFLWLSLGALLQPMSNTTGWLFITQDRTADMFRWGIVGSTLATASFVIGLPFGPVGVAASYTIVATVLGLPLLLWFVGRSGPVRGLDVLGTLALPGAVAAAVGVAAVAVRLALYQTSPAIGLLAAAVAGAAAGAGLLLALPYGRRRARELADLVRAGVSRRARPEPAPGDATEETSG